MLMVWVGVATFCSQNIISFKQIKHLDLQVNNLSGDAVNEICKILHKIKSCLQLEHCLEMQDQPRELRSPDENEIEKLQETLDRLHNTVIC